MENLAEILKEGRIKKGLTQLEVAQYLGFKSMDRISRWENGLAEPGAKNLMRLVVLYGISVEELTELLT